MVIPQKAERRRYVSIEAEYFYLMKPTVVFRVVWVVSGVFTDNHLN